MVGGASGNNATGQRANSVLPSLTIMVTGRDKVASAVRAPSLTVGLGVNIGQASVSLSGRDEAQFWVICTRDAQGEDCIFWNFNALHPRRAFP